MWTDEEFEALEQEELEKTMQILAALILLISNTKDALETELTTFYRKYGTDGVVTYNDARKIVSLDDRRKRLNVLTLGITRQFTDLYKNMEVEFGKLEDIILKTEFGFFDIDREDFELKPWGADNATWDERLDSDVRVWLNNVNKDVKQALIKGEHIDGVITKLYKRFGTIEKVTKRLVITESSAMTTLARKSIFKSLGASKYRYYTQADERVCDQCGPMHGKVFPISAYEIGVTAPPLHPNCRCFTIPIVD